MNFLNRIQLACRSSCWITVRPPDSASDSALPDFMMINFFRQSSRRSIISLSSGLSIVVNPNVEELNPLPRTCWAAVPALNVLTDKSSAVDEENKSKINRSDNTKTGRNSIKIRVQRSRRNNKVAGKKPASWQVPLSFLVGGLDGWNL